MESTVGNNYHHHHRNNQLNQDEEYNKVELTNGMLISCFLFLHNNSPKLCFLFQVNMTNNLEKVGMRNFELSKVLGTGGKTN
jgi:hypothetical protein